MEIAQVTFTWPTAGEESSYINLDPGRHEILSRLPCILRTNLTGVHAYLLLLYHYLLSLCALCTRLLSSQACPLAQNTPSSPSLRFQLITSSVKPSLTSLGSLLCPQHKPWPCCDDCSVCLGLPKG